MKVLLKAKITINRDWKMLQTNAVLVSYSLHLGKWTKYESKSKQNILIIGQMLQNMQGDQPRFYFEHQEAVTI